MSASTLEQQQQARHRATADARSVFVALADQDRLTKCLAAAGSLKTARSVCRWLRDLIEGGVKHIELSATANKVKTIIRYQTLAKLLPRLDRCQGITVKLRGDWGGLAPAVQALPLWLFAGVPNDALARIRTFAVSTSNLDHQQPKFIPLVSALAARMPSLRHLDLSGCHNDYEDDDDEGGWPHNKGAGAHLYSLFYADLAASCPQLETLALPSAAHLNGVEALAGSLVRLRVAGDDEAARNCLKALWGKASWSFSQLEHLRELSLESLLFDDEDEEDAGPSLRNLLDSLPPSLEVLELPDVLYVDVMSIRFDFKHGQLRLVDVRDGFRFGKELRALSDALLKCRALGVGVGGGVGGQQQRPSLRIRDVLFKDVDGEEVVDIAELAPLLEWFTLAPLDTITFEDLSLGNPGAVAQRVGDIVSVFGLPRELRDTSDSRLGPLPLGRVGASASAAAFNIATTAAIAHSVEMACRPPATGAMGTDADVGAVTGAVASTAAAAPSPHGQGSGQAGGSASLVALETAGVEDLLRGVAERLWADTSGVAGGPGPGGAARGKELGKGVLLHGPCRGPAEWVKVTDHVGAELQRRLPQHQRLSRVEHKVPPVQWKLAGPRSALAMCDCRGSATQLVTMASSSPGGPCVRHGIQATQLRAGAVKSALEQVLLELWHGSAASGPIMSQERRLGRLVELMVEASRLAEWDC